ncbi:MAG: ATP cone domain-containing protein [Chthoniobacterales bacterium]
MIALKDHLPLVQFPDGKVTNFEASWLIQSLLRAANAAGYTKWWLAEHVAASVANYLEKDVEDQVVTTERLQKAVKNVLHAIGYNDISTHFVPQPLPVRISLSDLAKEAGNGYELIFFGLLRERLRQALDSPAEEVQLLDIQDCVKTLRATKTWQRSCSGLRSEIVTFVYGEIESTRRFGNLSLRVT